MLEVLAKGHALRVETIQDGLELQLTIESGIATAQAHYDQTRLKPADLMGNALTLPVALHAAIHKRQIEYLAGRYCASRALSLLGSSSTLVGRSTAGIPIWPDGYHGSITHARGIAAAVAAPSDLVRGIGIDCEFRQFKASLALRQRVLDDAELAHLLSYLSPRDAFLVAFSAKESLYKCLHPICNTFFGFQDARIVRVDTDCLELELLKALPKITRTHFLASYALTAESIQTQVVFRR